MIWQNHERPVEENLTLDCVCLARCFHFFASCSRRPRFALVVRAPYALLAAFLARALVCVLGDRDRDIENYCSLMGRMDHPAALARCRDRVASVFPNPTVDDSLCSVDG